MAANDWKNEKKVKYLYFSLLTCLYQGKNCKADIQRAYEKAKSTKQAGSIPWELPSKNRFATIEYIRASHWEEGDRQARVKEIEKPLDNFLEENPNDREILLQKGILLQQKGKLDASQKIFQKLYRESPQIAKGTIGLKAYYNMGCNLLAQKRFYEAQTYFQKIKRELSQPQSDTKTASVNDRSKYLDDLPGTDLLADIDEGWCLKIQQGKGPV